MRELIKELRVSVRSLAKQPGLSSLAILALGMGIGFTAIMYSIVHGALYRGLPFPDGDRIYAFLATNPSEGIEQTSISIADFADWRDQQDVVPELGAFYNGTVNVTGSEGPRRYDGAFMTASTFRILGVQPVLGRSFSDADDVPGAPLTLILGHQVWEDDFGSDRDVLGQQVKVNGEMAIVIGVMPEGFLFPNVEQVWVPLRPDPLAVERGAGSYVTPIGKLPPDVTVEQAQAQYSGIAGRIAEQYPDLNEGLDARVMLYTDMTMDGEGKTILLSMLATVFLVLILACVNVANLLLARAAGRTKELAIRTAMGANRRRVLAHLLTEAGVLTLAGTLVGLVIAKVGIDLFSRMVVDTEPPFWFVFALDGPIILFVVLSAVVAALVAGLIPGIKASSGKVSELLKDESRGSSSMRIGKLSRLLVMGEVAMSVGLLVTAGLMVKGMVKLRTMEYGFERHEVFTARIGIFPNDFEDDASKQVFFRDLRDGLLSRPEITHASLSDVLPGLSSGRQLWAVEGETYPTDRDYPSVRTVRITPGYFETVNVEPTQGRAFNRTDVEGSLPVAVVNQTFVRRFSSEGDVIGRRVRMGGSESEEPWRTIVGVVPDLYMEGVGNSGNEPQGIYIPLAQADARFVSIAVRGMGEPGAFSSMIRDEVVRHSPDTPIYWPRLLQEAVAEDLWFVNVFGGLFAIFGLGALFLAAVGLYGVMAFSVKQRTHEVGIRMALGADGGRVLGLVLRQGAVQVVIGLLIGLGIGALLSRGLREGFTLVEPWDPQVFLSICAVLLTTAFMATIFPARRATKVDPVEALRD